MSNKKFRRKNNIYVSKGELMTYMLKASPGQETLNMILNSMERDLGRKFDEKPELFFPVFKSVLGEKTFYICWSGGKISEERGIEFTIIGQGSVESLKLYPEGNDEIAFMELKLTEVPLQEKVISYMKTLPNNTKICFFGDLANELDGKLFRAFNVHDFNGNSMVR